MLLITVAVAGYAVKRERDRVEAVERIALARKLALVGAEFREDDGVRARNIGLAAVKMHSDEYTRAALIDTLVEWRKTDMYALNPNAVADVAISGDGGTALFADMDDVFTVKLRTWLDEEVGIMEKASPVKLAAGADVMAVALSADGRIALTGDSDGTTGVWDLSGAGRPARRATLPTTAKDEYRDVESVALSRDGRIGIVGDFPGDLTVWDLTDPARPRRLSSTRAHDSTRDVELSGDGRTALTSSEKSVTIWDLTDPAKPVKTADLALPEDFAETTAMSEDGRTILVANAERADIWKLDDRARPVHTAMLDTALPGGTYDVALTPDGKTALLAGAGGAGSVWNLAQPYRPVRLASLRGYSQEVGYVALSSDGAIALMASPDRGLSIWDLRELAAIVADPAWFVCSRSDWPISNADWIRYTGTAAPPGFEDGDEVSLCSIR
ncbi:WD40 repeat domain-containing protein [Nonomuraea sp. NN258]|uniref:WD40 repeat domain-containing protein n=1 Tax=Nonomuraea antri TaxID=2730852 RepID=UPI00156A4821|nr:WD40 repeat domain-containing protein [Nonomuraea antri]NRQ32368.1 WD40 repeat domain-containing protein [Nonomuraea antri]